MKTFLPFIGFTLFVLLYTSSLTRIDHRLAFNFGDKKSLVLVFDGYEGGYLFFTDPERQAVVLEVTNPKILKNVDLINGDYVGKKLKVDYEEVEVKTESSTMGIIETLKLLP